MKLYYSPGACSLSAHIAMHEAGLPFEAIAAPTKTHKLPDGTDYYTINPLGYVPYLTLDNGKSLHEGPAIVQYIADQVPGKSLAPANGTYERYKLQEWLTFIGTELHKTFSPLFSPATPAETKTGSMDKLQNRLKWVNGELVGKLTQRVAQVLAWHHQNEMSFEELAAKMIKPLTGPQVPYFHPEEIRAAMQAKAYIAKQLEEKAQGSSTALPKL